MPGYCWRFNIVFDAGFAYLEGKEYVLYQGKYNDQDYQLHSDTSCVVFVKVSRKKSPEEPGYYRIDLSGWKPSSSLNACWLIMLFHPTKMN
jgi:hypothetical protein